MSNRSIIFEFAPKPYFNFTTPNSVKSKIQSSVCLHNFFYNTGVMKFAGCNYKILYVFISLYLRIFIVSISNINISAFFNNIRRLFLFIYNGIYYFFTKKIDATFTFIIDNPIIPISVDNNNLLNKLICIWNHSQPLY